jgi:asparagine synthase (glutamine-hydrolysing)
LPVPAASSLSIDSSGIRKQIYWSPEIRPEIVPPRPEAAFEALRELLFRAVDSRLTSESPVAAELSGGLDSSAITSIAAKCMEKRGRTLVALSAVVPEDLRVSHRDEREYIDTFRSWPNIQIEYVTADGRGPFDGIEDPGRFAISPARTSRTFLYEAFAEVAARNGVQGVLQGNLGEFGPTCKADRYLVELAVCLRWSTLYSELRKAAQIQHRSAIRILANRVREVLPPWPGARPNRYVLLTDQARKRGKSLSPFHTSSPFQRSEQRAMIEYYLRAASQSTSQPIGGISYTKPLLDKRVVEFCLAAPPEFKFRDGYSRYLIRGALDGILPPKIQWRMDKMPFSPDYFARYNAQLAKAKAFVAAIGPTDPVRSVIDVGGLEKLLEPVAPGVRSQRARAVVPLTIYTICFLRQFSEYRP